MKKTLTTLKSPLTGGRVYEVEDIETKEFRKETFEVHVRYYLCEDSGEQFTTTSQDELFVNELYSQWRVQHGVPFPDEIRAIREKYGLKYTQMSKILGFGANQWRQYEAGMVPSESQGKMIRMIFQKQAMLTMLESSRKAFSEQEYASIKNKIEESSDTTIDRYQQMLMYGCDQHLSVENGFGMKNPAKLTEMVQYLVEHCKTVSPTKLNKLMFYSDFQQYRKTGRSISGLKYRAIQYGPVPEHYDTIYDHIPGLDKNIEVFQDGKEATTFRLNQKVKIKYLTEPEQETLNEILSRFGQMKAKDLVEISHQETGWKDNETNHEFISYTYAFSLKGIGE